MKKIIFIFVIASFISADIINKIVIAGNEITQDNTILKLIHHVPGDSIDIQLAIEDQMLLFNTGLFNDVIIYPSKDIYYIYVLEKPKLFPKIAIDKHDILGWSYGGSLLFNNISGENRKLQLSILGGQTTLIDIKYSNPILTATNDSININLYNKYFTSPEDDYIIDKRGINLSLAFYSNNPSHQLQLSNKIEYNKILFLDKPFDEEHHYSMRNTIAYIKNQANNLFKVKLSYINFNTTYKKYFSLDIQNNYYLYFNPNKKDGRLLVKNYAKINFSDDVPLYNQTYIISETNVRGYTLNDVVNEPILQNKLLLCNNIITSTLQIELPLFNKKIINTKLLLFWDFGIGSNNYKKYDLKNKIRSHGFGIRYNIMKLGSIDFCIGMNPYNATKTIQTIVNFKYF